MTSKVIYLLVVLCAFQYAQAKGSQVRGLADDYMNKLMEIVKGVEQAIEDAESKVQDAINSANDLASQMMNSTTQSIQHLIQDAKDEINSYVDDAVQAGKDVSACLVGQFEALENIGSQAGPDLINCTQTQIANLVYILEDLQNLKQQLLAEVAEIPGGLSNCSIDPICLFKYYTSVAAKLALLTSSVSNDLLKLATYTADIATKLAECGKDELTKVASEIEDIVSNVISCILNAPASS